MFHAYVAKIMGGNIQFLMEVGRNLFRLSLQIGSLCAHNGKVLLYRRTFTDHDISSRRFFGLHQSCLEPQHFCFYKSKQTAGFVSILFINGDTLLTMVLVRGHLYLSYFFLKKNSAKSTLV